MYHLSALRFESDHSHHVIARALARSFMQHARNGGSATRITVGSGDFGSAALGSGGICERFVELNDEVIFEIVGNTPAVARRVTDDLVLIRNYGYRIVRAAKNRFGSVSEIGIFEMQQSGLREVLNPSEILISQHSEDTSGIAIAATIEGLRPFLIETQALVSPSVYGHPQRSSTGFDLRRLEMLLAVLEKRCGLKLNTKDVFLNITGGIYSDDPAADLSVIAAIVSSALDMPIDSKTCFAGEIGLSGEIRPVNRIEQRINEARKLGYKKIFISSYNPKDVYADKIEIIRLEKIEKMIPALFSGR